MKTSMLFCITISFSVLLLITLVYIIPVASTLSPINPVTLNPLASNPIASACSPFSCIDSDGNNPNILGVVSYSPYCSSVKIELTDFCSGKSTLVEYLCTDNGLTSSIINCKNGCLNGACNLDSGQGSGLNPSASGTINHTRDWCYGADINKDGAVNGLDLDIWKANAGASCFACIDEICDGKDNDCNDIIDDGLGTTTCGLGICNHTIQNCVNATTQTCNPLQGKQNETCNGLDDDCDGSCDESMHAGCNPTCTCDAGWTNCYNGLSDGCETNTQSDKNNCGSCGHVCTYPTNSSCSMGICH